MQNNALESWKTLLFHLLRGVIFWLEATIKHGDVNCMFTDSMSFTRFFFPHTSILEINTHSSAWSFELISYHQVASRVTRHPRSEYLHGEVGPGNMALGNFEGCWIPGNGKRVCIDATDGRGRILTRKTGWGFDRIPLHNYKGSSIIAGRGLYLRSARRQLVQSRSDLE